MTRKPPKRRRLRRGNPQKGVRAHDLRRVAQRELTGCGVACVATLAGLSYMDARLVVFDCQPRAFAFTKTRDLHKALRLLGIRSRPRLQPLGRRGLATLATDAIVKVDPIQNGYHWHWVVWDHKRQQILDPARAKAKRRYRVVSALPIL